ncbi:MAG: esterase/lipase family protein [Nannocystales bacterium]
MRWIAEALLGCTLVACGGSEIRTVPIRFGDGAAERIDGLTPCTVTSAQPGRLDPDAPLTLLVHGCNDSAGRFTTLADVFEAHGQQAICFTYESRDTIETAAQRLRGALAQLEQRLPEQPITVLGHSQGGLVARHALTATVAEPNLTAEYKLGTISSPFAGIDAARHCSIEWLYVLSLGITPAICRGIAGKNWPEIHRDADLVTEPGQLSTSVASYLQIRTDERGTCRRLDAKGRCAEDDFVFSLDEQRNPKATGPGFRALEVQAGHVQIVGFEGEAPTQLIALLQAEGVMNPTPVEQQDGLARLLTRLYRDDVPPRLASRPSGALVVPLP